MRIHDSSLKLRARRPSVLMRLWMLQLLASPTLLMANLPPAAAVSVVTEKYHGVEVADPYRAMEQFNDPHVQDWVKAQADFASRTLAGLPSRSALLDRIRELDAGSPFTIASLTPHPSGTFFYFKQLAGENVAKLYSRHGTHGEERLLIDPESFPKPAKGGHVTLSFFRVAPDASRVLYGFAESGSEQTTLRILDVGSGRDLPESIDRIEEEYALPSWLPDGKAFVYSRKRAPKKGAAPADAQKFSQAFLHEIGTPVSEDRLVFANGASGSPSMEALDFPAVILPPGSQWALGQIKHGDETDLTLYAARIEELGSPKIRWIKICDRSEMVTKYGVRGEEIFLLTALDAPRFKVVSTPLHTPDLANAPVVVPPGVHVVDSLTVAEDALYVGVLAGVPNTILRVPYASGAATDSLTLPAEEPAASVIAGRHDQPGVYVSTRSWTRAGRICRYDPSARALVDTEFAAPGKFDVPQGMTSTEVLVPSHDGVSVPLSIIHRKDIRLDGSNPALLTGYGAYGFTFPMRFRATDQAWIERGGVIALAHVRGGGAFGKEWHHAGRKLTKPNTWKDFIACAEYLVKAGYTSSSRLAGQGGSAGGILIGRAITERPDLFAAAHIAVGCTDMIRFETTSNGPPNVPEFGAITDPHEFRALLEMSTYHHIVQGVSYPAVLFTHGINDPRVEPWLSAKATARFQAASASGKPVLFRVDYHAGHGIGSTRAQRQEELADVWSFLLWQFGDPAFQPN